MERGEIENLKKYEKYYYLENYLFDDVNKNFRERGFLTPEEFFAIVIWKANRAKTKVRDGIKKSGKTIREITQEVCNANTPKQKLKILDSIAGIGIPIDSAVLTVLYPNVFSIVDYRSRESLKDFGYSINSINGNPTENFDAYLNYLDKCKELAHKYGRSLRDFDRMLWGKDFFEGENGLRKFTEGLK